MTCDANQTVIEVFYERRSTDPRRAVMTRDQTNGKYVSQITHSRRLVDGVVSVALIIRRGMTRNDYILA
jgi:hypothetical protein